MRAHLLPPAQPGLQEVGCVLADGPLRHPVRTNSQEGPKSSSGLLGTGYAGPPRGPVVQWFSTGRPGPGWRGRLLAPSSDGSLLRSWLPREQTAAPGPASTVHRSIGHTWSVWGWTAWPASAVVSSKELPTPPGTVRLAGPPFLGRPFPAERRPSSPAACALPAVRPEWRGVGWRQVPGIRPPTAVRAPECRRPPPPPPSTFSPAAQNDRSVGRPRRSRPAGTPCVPRSGCASARPPPPRGGGRCPPVPVRPPCPGRSETGTRLLPSAGEPAEGSLTAERPERPRAPARKPSAASQNATPLRHRARPSPWRIPGWRSGPRPPGRPGERTGRGCGLLRPGGPDPLAREGPGSGRGARARASPAPDPPGAARRKSQAPPETEPTPTRHDPGRVNRIVVPPWAWTTPESPAVPGRQGGLGVEEPGPAREPRLHPTRAGGWASPGRLARLGAARLGTGDSRPRRADGRRAGGAETPLRCQVPWPVDRAEGFEDSRGSSRSSGRDRRRRGCPGPEPPRETHPSPAWWGGSSRAERLETFLESWRLTPKRGSLTGCRAVTPRGRRTGGAAFLPPLLPRQVGER
ncbi:hypothetical protein NDU88_006334 [Pleurodeles waltl]|uniref:Basic proline-rich protein-like n=1 Tax=Pleurodeles waltl TaxID=8319 RepID=A0AAV7TD70_PLEWA|nr:hypothetical protein NDU88_006334 [Pleurodeles waltl]